MTVVEMELGTGSEIGPMTIDQRLIQ